MLQKLTFDIPDDAEPYDILREGLIWGRWKSGERLMPKHIKQELNCTSSVLREALIRLAGEGFVVAEKNLGFRAITHTEETFREAAHLRLILECEGAQLSLAKGDFEWEINLSAAFNKLSYIENQMVKSKDISEYVQRWSLQDWDFHYTLLSACGSELLLSAYRRAYDTFRMYAVSEISEFGFSGLATINEHKACYEAAIARDAKACQTAIKDHLTLYQDNNRSDIPLPPKS